MVILLRFVQLIQLVTRNMRINIVVDFSSLPPTCNIIVFAIVFVCSTSSKISLLYRYVADMGFVSWSYLAIWSLEAAKSEHKTIGNMIVYLVYSKIVVVMSSLS